MRTASYAELALFSGQRGCNEQEWKLERIQGAGTAIRTCYKYTPITVQTIVSSLTVTVDKKLIDIR